LRYLFEDYVFDTARRELWRGATAVAVEPQIFDLLACLIENRARVVSKDDLLTIVWAGRTVSDSTLSSSINAARTVLGDSGEEQRLIRTLPRKGFRFVGPVRDEEVASAPPAEPGHSAGESAAVAPAQPRDDRRTEPSATGPARVASPRGALPASPTTLVVSAGAVAAVAAMLLYLLWPASNAPRNASTVASGQRFDASSVPLVGDEARRSLANYPNRPDAKALAITGEGMGVADGEANAEAAKQDALRQCTARTKRQCRIYAVGMEVVWSKEALPLPAPADLRFEPLKIPLVPDDVPLVDRNRRERIANEHMKAPNHRALALTTGGAWTIPARATRAEAARLALERCAEYWQRPCLVLSVDGLLTIQIPKSRRVVGIFLPSTEADIPAEHKERIGRIYQGAEWRALARGKNGSWHATAAAPSEATAIETALKSCSQADTECRLYAIGNFRVAE
jgi:DNA-binding winged helix-turn-helix (wHTH) protein